MTIKRRQNQPPVKDGCFCVGVVIGAHGIRGDVLVKAFTEYPEGVVEYGALIFDNDAECVLKIKSVTPKGLLCHIKLVDTRNRAEELKGTYIYAQESQREELGEDDAYLTELEGMSVVLEKGHVLGVIRSGFDAGAGTVLSVKTGEEDVLIPFSDDVVVRVDRKNNQLVVTDFTQQFFEL